ncbi:MAG: phosphoribosyl-ATP diphosphatase [Ruminococcaceae bacterium]|nr:phosphoribosyl-ATP diphosphatase [Oscillospiraceae bacterium]
MDYIRNDYETILARRDAKLEGSYTGYLFEQGIDKILKKIGEESSEVIIAAKNAKNEDTVGEICDLLYHTLVLMAYQGISIEDVEAELDRRAQKAGNLKQFHEVDKNS